MFLVKPGGTGGSLRVRNERELTLFVARTTVLCVAFALAFDVVNQLVFFESWLVALRSWTITLGVVVVITVPVARTIGKAHLALYRASQIDPLTGLLNRGALFEAVADDPRLMVLIIVDVDRFKQVNDTHGHLVGDQVLQAVATMMRTMLSGFGRVGRLGGEEFAVLSPGGEPDRLRDGLEAFRRRLAQTPILAGPAPVFVTISAGIACRRPGQSFEALYAEADRALYRAKAGGRNRIVVSDGADAPDGAGDPMMPAGRADLHSA